MKPFVGSRTVHSCVVLALLLSMNDLYVDVNAPNCATGTGQPTDPFCNINDALLVAQSGDTIHIAPGTYVENLVLGQDVNLIGTGGAPVTIVDGNQAGSVVTVQSSAVADITGLTLTNGKGSNGGGINGMGMVTLTSSTVSGNTATSKGGGIFSDFGLTVDRCTVSGNAVVGGPSPDSHNVGGGGLNTYQSLVTITNSTISGNSSFKWGGGIFFYYGTMSLSNTTVTGNTAMSFGGGVFNYTFSQFPQVKNSIIAANAAPSSNDVWGVFTSNGSNVIGDDSGAFGFTDGIGGDQVGSAGSPLDPVLGPLADHGGPTFTHEPMGGSPALDAGDTATAEPTDQRGVTRPQGPSSDVGALELGPPGAVAPMSDCFSNPGTLAHTAGVPAVDGTFTLTMDAGQASGALGIVGFAVQPIPGWPPCGLPVPALGELLIDVPVADVSGTWLGIGAPLVLPVGVPDQMTLVGATVYAQGLFVAPFFPTEVFRLTNGLEVLIGE